MLTEDTIANLKRAEHSDTLPALLLLRERVGTDGIRIATTEMFLRDIPEAERPRFEFSGPFLKKHGLPTPMLVDRLIPDKSLVLLAGKAKLGKSYVALQIMEDVEQGRAVFGKYHLHRKGTVCYLGMEDGNQEIMRRLRHRGHYEDEDRALAIYSERLPLGTAEGVDTLRAMIAEFPEGKRDPVLIVVDTARESLGIKDNNDSAQVTEALRALREFAHETCAVLLVTHNRKMAGENSGDEIAGSGAFASSCDGWISGTHGEKIAGGNRRISFTVVGRGDMNTEFTVEMDTNTLEIRALTDDELTNEEEAKARAKRNEKYDRILGAITALGGEATITQMAEKIGLSENATRVIVLEAERMSVIEKTAEKIKPLGAGKPATGYRIISLKPSIPPAQKGNEDNYSAPAPSAPAFKYPIGFDPDDEGEDDEDEGFIV